MGKRAFADVPAYSSRERFRLGGIPSRRKRIRFRHQARQLPTEAWIGEDIITESVIDTLFVIYLYPLLVKQTNLSYYDWKTNKKKLCMFEKKKTIYNACSSCQGPPPPAPLTDSKKTVEWPPKVIFLAATLAV